jgi:hypothetical protein
MRRSLPLALALLVLVPVSVAADATAFIGAYTNPERQQVRGFAAGVSILIVGFEGEYATAGEDDSAGTPSLTTFSGNISRRRHFPFSGCGSTPRPAPECTARSSTP